MDLFEAKVVLGLEGIKDFTASELKSAYRVTLRRVHPDAGGSQKETEQAIAAYRLLSEQTEGIEELLLGRPLSEYGRGLGPTINGAPCKSCDGKGYQVVEHRIETWEMCPKCGGEGWTVNVPCRKCNGTGRFGHGECWACHGTGVFVLDREVPCDNCNPSKVSRRRWIAIMRNDYYVSASVAASMFRQDFPNYGRVQVVSKVVRYYTLCHDCKGVGEHRIYNAVLPKGRLAEFR